MGVDCRVFVRLCSFLVTVVSVLIVALFGLIVRSFLR